MTHHPMPIAEIQRAHDDAMACADTLRRKAIAEFWHDAAQWLRATMKRLHRGQGNAHLPAHCSAKG